MSQSLRIKELLPPRATGTSQHAAQRQAEQTQVEERSLPGVLRCAGLMVPDPSIMLPPIPFIEVVTGWVVEYMATVDGTAAGSGDQRPLDARKRLSPQLAGEQRAAEGRLSAQWTNVSLAGNGALGVACRLAGRE